MFCQIDILVTDRMTGKGPIRPTPVERFDFEDGIEGGSCVG
jgi:hypothetical protein